jgi:sugar phosphate isomerase/epimerase
MAILCSTSAFKGSLEEALDRTAALGFGEVDLIAIPSWNHVVPAALADGFAAEAERIESLLRRRGLRARAMNLAVRNLHERSDAGRNAQRRAEVEAVARLMRRLDVGVCSFYPGYLAAGRPWEDILCDELASVGEILDIGRSAGVTFAVEPHAQTPFQTVDEVRRLLAAAPGLPVAYDPSHFVMQGLDLRTTEEFLDRTVHVHLRDAAPGAMQAPWGAGGVDLDWLLGALDRRVYRGHFSIEYLPGLPDVESQIRRVRECLAAALPGGAP